MHLMLKHEKEAAAAASNTETPQNYLRPAKAAQRVDISRALLYDWLSDGRVKSHRIGGVRLVSIASLEAFISSHAA